MKVETFVGLAVILLVVVLIVFGPLAVIWAINTLFGLSIPYTLKTWAASIILSATASPNVKVKKN